MKKIATLLLTVLTLVTCVLGLTACGSVSSIIPDVAPHEHSFGEWTIVSESTCAVEGKQTRSCACGHVETQALPLSDAHVYGEWKVEKHATCQENGIKARKCTVCKKSQDAEIDKANGYHNYGDDTVCDVEGCGYQSHFTVGLSYTLSADELYYTLAGKGSTQATDIIVPESYMGLPVQEVKSSAFLGNAALTSITLPDTVTVIGNNAFNGCSALTNITVPEGVKEIHPNAFRNCSSVASINYNAVNCNDLSSSDNAFYGVGSSLTETLVTIGPKVTRIPANLFYSGTAKIHNLIVSASVRSMGSGAFKGCENYLANVKYDGAIEQWATIDFENEYANPLSAHANILLYSGIFEGEPVYTSPIVSIEFPNTLTSISDYAFYGCISLKTVILPDTVESIGKYAFGKVWFLESVTMSENLKTIDDYAFYDCYTLPNITIPTNVETIGNAAFSGCTGLTRVDYYGTIDQWAKIGFNKNGSSTNPLYYAKHLYINDVEVTNVALTSATKISPHAFSGGEYITQITIPASVKGIGAGAFSYCSLVQNIVIPQGITVINNGTFFGCTSLQTVSLPSSLTSIGQTAFYECTSLQNITIPASVTSIGNHIFFKCTSLSSITFEDNSQLHTIGTAAFGDCSKLTTITIPEKVTQLEGAFNGCTLLESITLPAGLERIIPYRLNAFENCNSLNKVNFTGTLDQWASISFTDEIANPLYYAKNLYINDVKVTSVDFSSIETISDYAFYNCASIIQLNIPACVKELGDCAFYGCENLETVTFADNSNCRTISWGMFGGCTSLTAVTIPNSVTTIGGSAFSNCTAQITWESGMQIQTLSSAFANYKGESLTVPASVTRIELGAFTNSAIKTLSFETGSQCQTVDFGAFTGMLYLENLTIPFVGQKKDGSGNVTFGYMFGADDANDYEDYVPSSIKSITILGGAIIGEKAFYGLNGAQLTSITIPASVTSIGENAFNLRQQSSSEKSVIFTGTTNQWANIQFAKANANPLVLSKAELYINGNKVTNLTFENGLQAISSYAFSGFNGTSVTIPSSITSIGNGAFDNCRNLTAINFNATAMQDIQLSKAIFLNAGFNGTGIVATIGANVTKIPQALFIQISKLTNVIFETGSQCQSIGSHAFYNCTGLQTITIPASATWIGDYAFEGCAALASVTFEDTSTWYHTGYDTATNGELADLSTTPSENAAAVLEHSYRNWYKV